MGASDHAAARAEGERLHHVLARTNAAVKQNLDAIADHACDFRQSGDRCRRAVELPPAVVGHDDPISANRDRGSRVIDVEDALDDEFAGPQAANPFHVAPVERLVEMLGGPLARAHHADAALIQIGLDVSERLAVTHEHAKSPAGLGRDVPQIAQRQTRRHGEPVLDVGVTLPAQGQIDGDDEHGALRRFRAVDHRLAEAAVAQDIELEPERAADRGADVLDGRNRHGGQAIRNAGRFGGARRQNLAAAAQQAGQPGRRDCKRHRDLVAEEFGFERAGGGVDENALTKAKRVQGVNIRLERDLVIGAALDILE